MGKMLSLFALLLFAGMAFADIVPSAFSVSPTAFRPGVAGTLSFTLTNTGSTSITGVELFPAGYPMSFFSDKVSVGTLGPGASTTVAVPFKVNENAPAGVYNLQVSGYWTDVDTNGYKTFSYPITVSSSITFQVSSIEVEQGQITPGDAFTVAAVITNTGGQAKNVRLTSSSTEFTFSGSSQILLGDAAGGQNSSVRIPLIASSSLSPGVYTVPITVTYEDGLGATQTSILSISPVSISKRSSYISVSMSPGTSRILPGQKVTVTVNLTNVGTEEARFVKVTLAANGSAFVLLNSGEKYVSSIPVGGTQSVTFDLGVNAATPAGFYPVLLYVAFSDSRGVSQTPLSQYAGLDVAGVTSLDVISSTSPSLVTAGSKYSLSLQVSNIGTSQLKSVRVQAAGDGLFELLGSPYSYIGTLNVDDYSTVTYPVLVHGSVEPGAHTFDVTLTYRDADNVERSVVKQATLYVVSPEVAAAANGAGMGGINYYLVCPVVLVLGVAAYFGYKRFFGRKKA